MKWTIISFQGDSLLAGAETSFGESFDIRNEFIIHFRQNRAGEGPLALEWRERNVAERNEIYTEVVAESQDCQKALRRCRAAERFKLDMPSSEREGGQPVKVLRRSGEVVGHLEEGVSSKLMSEIERGAVVEAFALLVTDGSLYPKRRNVKRTFLTHRPRHCYLKIIIGAAHPQN
jgi:hypothetical protein